MYKRQHFTNLERYILLFNHSLKITDPKVFVFFLFAYNCDKTEFLHKLLYEILEKEAKGVVL